MTGVSSLAPFAHDWVGGDIRGLSALAGQCYRIPPKITAADATLTTRAGELVCTAGWQGNAAGAFYAAWETDAAAGRQLASAWEQIAQIIDALAVSLAALESVLERAAAVVEAQGVAIDQGTGIPEPTITAAQGPSAVRIARLLGEYDKLRSAILLRAQAVRAAAAAGLQALASAMLPGARGGPLAQNGPGPLITGLNLARSLWATPTKYRLAAEKELPVLEDNLQQAERSAVRELMAARRLFGKGAPMPAGARDQLSQAIQEYNDLQGKIDAATGLESAGTKVAAGDAEGLGLPGLLDGAGGIAGIAVKAVPWVGSGAGIFLTVAGDLQKGESVPQAAGDAAASTGAGIGTAVGVSNALGLGGAAESSLAVAGAETGGVGVVAIGAGDLVHHLVQEPWSTDWGQDGPVVGTLHGIANSAGATGSDIAGMPSAVVHEGESLLSGAEHNIASFGQQLIP